MNRIIHALPLVAFALLWSTGTVLPRHGPGPQHARTNPQAPQSGTAAEAKSMLERAIAALKANKAMALNEFNDENNKKFRKGDLYVFCVNISDGKITSHVAADLLGTDIQALEFKDDPFGQRLYNEMKRVPEEVMAKVDYSYPKPGTTEPIAKESFVTRVRDQGCGVGYYK